MNSIGDLGVKFPLSHATINVSLGYFSDFLFINNCTENSFLELHNVATKYFKSLSFKLNLNSTFK